MLCLLANVNRDPKRCPRPFRPAEFHPLVRAEHDDGPDLKVKGVGIFKTVFIDNRMTNG